MEISDNRPIYKLDPKTGPNNYRPICVTSVFSRILDRLAHNQLYEFLKINKSNTCNQAAFRKLYSTATSLMSNTDFWDENMDHSMVNLTIFLNVKKAFDTVDQVILLTKSHAYRI